MPYSQQVFKNVKAGNTQVQLIAENNNKGWLLLYNRLCLAEWKKICDY